MIIIIGISFAMVLTGFMLMAARYRIASIVAIQHPSFIRAAGLVLILILALLTMLPFYYLVFGGGF